MINSFPTLNSFLLQDAKLPEVISEICQERSNNACQVNNQGHDVGDIKSLDSMSVWR